MSWAGDWMCGACQHLNFKKRDSYQRCGFSKYGYSTNMRSDVVLAGDWYCHVINCGSHNYASRTSCFRCGAHKDEHVIAGAYHGGHDMMSSSGYASQPTHPGWKPGDWMCNRPGCGVHNYACRIESFKCKTPRDFGETL